MLDFSKLVASKLVEVRSPLFYQGGDRTGASVFCKYIRRGEA
ncbi:hypothetical protein [Microcoleus anatoxicus]